MNDKAMGTDGNAAMSVFTDWERCKDTTNSFREFAASWLKGVPCGAFGPLSSQQAAVIAGIVDSFVDGATSRQRKWLDDGTEQAVPSAQTDFDRTDLYGSVDAEMRRDGSEFQDLPRDEVRRRIDAGNRLFAWLKRILLGESDKVFVDELKPYLAEFGDDGKELVRRFSEDDSQYSVSTMESVKPDRVDWDRQDIVDAMSADLEQGNVANAVRSADVKDMAVPCIEAGLATDFLSSEEILLKKLYAMGFLSVLLPNSGEDVETIWLMALFAAKRAIHSVAALKTAVHQERFDKIRQALGEQGAVDNTAITEKDSDRK